MPASARTPLAPSEGRPAADEPRAPVSAERRSSAARDRGAFVGPRVAIVGAGAAGLAAAKALDGCDAEVLLIERGQRSGGQAVGPLDVDWRAPASDAAPVCAGSNLVLIGAEVGGIDPIRGMLQLSGPSDEPMQAAFDYLVLAIGAPAASPRFPQVSADAALLTSMDRRVTVEAQVWGAVRAAEQAINRFERARLLTFAIIGAGRRGAEMASRVAHLARQACEAPGSRVDPEDLAIIVFEAGLRPLRDLEPAFARRARLCLHRLGVRVQVRSEVTWVDRYGLAVGEMRTFCATVIWTGQTPTAHLVQDVCWRTDSLGRASVGDRLQVVGYTGIYVAGAAAAVVQAGRAPPATEALARQQGRYVGELIRRRLAGDPEPGPFRFSVDPAGESARTVRPELVSVDAETRIRRRVGSPTSASVQQAKGGLST